MDTNDIFKKFIIDRVDLNPAREKRIENAERVLSEFISNSDNFKDLYVKTTAQGSYRQKTIIKPVDEDAEFDVDLLIELKENPSWDAKIYLSKLAEIFKDSERYKDITETVGKIHCVTIDYEGEFHVDLVPVINKNGKYLIFNKTANITEETDGDSYAQWFTAQNSFANGNLVDAVKLIKYLRDRRGDFDTKSIILTTLSGMMVSGGIHNDLPNSLASILSGMDIFLGQHQNPPTINNPARPGENFNRHWKNDTDGFKKLKNAIFKYAKIASEAVNLSEEKALSKWAELFGDEFKNIFQNGGGLTGNVTRKSNQESFVGNSPLEKPWFNSI